MLNVISLLLFESTTANAVWKDPANEDWLAVVRGVSGKTYNLLARRYYLALAHFRRQANRAALPGRVEVKAEGKQQAFLALLGRMKTRSAAEKKAAARDEPAIFIEAGPDAHDESLPAALRDLSARPPPLSDLLDGPGRPPVDALCMMRAFLAAPLLRVGDSPSAVYALLRSNPTFASACGFLGRDTYTQPGELTSRRLPSMSKLEDFSEVMTRFGLWHLACADQVRDNLTSGVIEIEDTLVFDTTHIEANSHCGHVVPPAATPKANKKPKHKKVPRPRKICDCGKAQWEDCSHVWVPTDQGAAVVVKAPTRIYWAHKTSVVTFGRSEIPLDVRVLQYAAEHDGKTLVPHLELLNRYLPQVTADLRYVLADDAYKGKQKGVAQFGKSARLIVPVHPNRSSKAAVVDRFDGIDRFTPTGVPICLGGHRFEMRGRDILSELYIWVAPDDADGKSTCADCPFADTCGVRGARRYIRVARADFPQINWDHPQHLTRNRDRYKRRTGVERAIKRLKVDLMGEHLTHRDSLRVQAHLDRKLLIFHLLLRAAAAPG